MTTIEKLRRALLNDDRVRNGWPPVDSLAHISNHDADAYRGSARAVLTALLEPSEAMVEAGAWFLRDFGSNQSSAVSTASFSAMIQAALDEVEG